MDAKNSLENDALESQNYETNAESGHASGPSLDELGVSQIAMKDSQNSPSKMGKIMRSLIRWVVLGIGLIAVGMLLVYLLLYQPVSKEFQKTSQELQDVKQQVDSLKMELSDLQATQLETRQQLEIAETRAKLLAALNGVGLVRFAIVNDDPATARVGLEAARPDIESLIEDERSVDEKTADLLKDRLDIVSREIDGGDLNAAALDLEKLNNTLLQLEKVLFN